MPRRISRLGTPGSTSTRGPLGWAEDKKSIKFLSMLRNVVWLEDGNRTAPGGSGLDE